MPCALDKTVMTEVSAHISEHVNFIYAFHDVNSTLYAATNINHKAGILLKVPNVFPNVNFTLFMEASIHSIRKREKKAETRKQDVR